MNEEINNKVCAELGRDEATKDALKMFITGLNVHHDINEREVDWNVVMKALIVDFKGA